MKLESENGQLIQLYGTRKRGLIHEQQCCLYFLTAGYEVSIPMGDYNHYDLILDAKGHLFRIQCKSPVFKNGCIHVNIYSTVPNYTDERRMNVVAYDPDDIDFISTYYEGICYLIPYSLDTPKSWSMRRDPPKSRAGISTIKWACEYEATYILNRMLDPDNTPIRDGLSMMNDILPPYKNSYLGTYHWITNGSENRKLFSGDLPEGFRFGRCMNV